MTTPSPASPVEVTEEDRKVAIDCWVLRGNDLSAKTVAAHREQAVAAMRQAATFATEEYAAWERWIGEMLVDYRIPFDSHRVGKQVALNTFIHSLNNELATLRAEKAALEAAISKANEILGLCRSQIIYGRRSTDDDIAPLIQAIDAAIKSTAT